MSNSLGAAKSYETTGVAAPERVIKMRKNWATGDAARDRGLKEPADIRIFRNIRYNRIDTSQLADIYLPGVSARYEKAPDAYPVLIDVHGGGYFYGDKELYRFYCMDMAKRGFAVINFNYRLSPENIFPAALEDINEVMCFVEQHAQEYSLNTEHVCMMGDSAGAQLTSHYAAINSNPEFAALYGFAPHGLKLRNIALACGMYNFEERMRRDRNGELMCDYFGKDSEYLQLLRRIYDKVENNENLAAEEVPGILGGGAENEKLLQGLNAAELEMLKMLDVYGAITPAYPRAFVFSAPNDFLYHACEPFAEYVNARGGNATSKIYGTKDMKEVGHVFHVNMKLPIGEMARKDQAKFLME